MEVLFQSNKKTASQRKLRGGYYTPQKLADFLTQWALKKQPQRILEPSCGDGNFIVSILRQSQKRHENIQITAVELDWEEIDKAQKRADDELNASGIHFQWICKDFFHAFEQLYDAEKFDLVIGNPPFIRFQNVNAQSREVAFRHLKNFGYSPTKLANAWAAFVQLSIELLRPGGDLVMVLPAELLQVNYAHELRNRITGQFEKIHLLTFKKLVFPEIQQEVVLLLAEGKSEKSTLSSDIHTIELEDAKALDSIDDFNIAINHSSVKHSREGMKWTSLFLSDSSFKALDEAERSDRLVSLGTFAQVDVGIVTGRNSFFVLEQHEVEKLDVMGFVLPIVGKTNALKSILFKKSDFNLFKQNNPSFLLNLNGIENSKFTKALQEYIFLAEEEEIHSGYKCRIRKRWYDVPSIYAPDAFLYRQIHKFPLLVFNEAGATSTDTVHRVRIKNTLDRRNLCAVFFNSLTFAWSEVCGRSYGGGVLELEPKEAEKLPIPLLRDIEIDPDKIDYLLREGRVQDALDYSDKIVLKDILGFDNSLIKSIRNAWVELRDRRIGRK